MAATRTAEVTLPGATSSVPEARRFVRSTLRSWELDGAVEPAALIVSELATNAVLHARSALTVRLRVDAGGSLHLEVLDGSARLPDQRRHSSEATTGRGLSIVAELASSWGVEQLTDGKSVWAVVEASAAGEGDTDAGAATGAVGRRETPAVDGPSLWSSRAAA